MDNFLVAKFQFEIRYTYILDFESHYKSILSPYLKFASGMQIHGQGTRNEYIKLLFEEDGYSIDCRWDRMVFVYEGEINNLKKNQSALNKIFFEIFDQISSLQSFGKITNYLIVANGVKLVENEHFEELVEKFTSHYLSDSANVHFDGDNKDSAIIVEYNKDGVDVTQKFGPYNCQNDIDKHDLLPFNMEEDTKLKKMNGLIMQLKFFEETAFINFDKTTVLIEEMNNIFQKFKQETEKL
ncbi:hypothetical protein LQ318_11310 [Aliifodinibius salicampi]|uniref:Uncharacterized protein n=1 Tax=Fodinibius salicampi TaxID=1920655 RepID=A0ABT3Q0C9_9BACT|nr:hypothetical protein [Fodinibius salicampi]MCW9713491.1 hypothetical protein [Fodinibius salicampi]